jgi:cytochrome c-type biogenesis protein CcmF
VLFCVVAFFLVLVQAPTHPFSTLARPPADGTGPPALLQNHPLMAVHPPALYLGFIGFTVPFAFAIGALLTPEVSDGWVGAIRRWTLVAWLFLTAGLVLGALWSYTVLGWGGYWAWDPVENLALLPWLTGAALLHAMHVTERRGTLRVWTFALVIATFALTIMGTFLTRGSVLASVHTFAESAVGPLFLAFLAIVLVGGFGLLAARSGAIGVSGPAPPLSRESVYLANNLVLVVAACTVLLGTLYPLLVQAFRDTQVAIGAPYFDRNVGPLALVLLLLIGIGPLASWRATSWRVLARRLALPAGAALASAAALLAVRTGNAAAVLALALAVFAALATIQAMLPRARPHDPRSVGVRLLDQLRGDPRRTGGMVAHLGFVLAIVGIVLSTSFGHEADLQLTRGTTASFGAYELRFDGATSERDPQRVVVSADLAVSRDGRSLGTLRPGIAMYGRSVVASPALHVGSPLDGFTDVTASLLQLRPGADTATIRVGTHPGALWLWLGGAVIVLGGLWSLAGDLARRRRRPTPGPQEVPAVREEVRT